MKRLIFEARKLHHKRETALHLLNHLRLAKLVGNTYSCPEEDANSGVIKEATYAWVGPLLFCPHWCDSQSDDEVCEKVGLLPEGEALLKLTFSEREFRTYVNEQKVLGVVVTDALMEATPEELAEVIEVMEKDNDIS